MSNEQEAVGLTDAERAEVLDAHLVARSNAILATVGRIVAAREAAAAQDAAQQYERCRVLLAKYEGRSKWVGFERPRREAWAEIEGDLRAALAADTAQDQT